VKNPFDQLNLRPQERRILVVVGLIIFIVLNILLVTPLFGQLAAAEGQLEKSKRTLAKYQSEIDQAATFKRNEDRLRNEGGDVLSQELQLQRIVNDQAIASGVQVSRYNPVMRTQIGRTNQFFEDQGLTIDFTTGGKELVEFLVGLASGNSMVHVQDMSLRPTAGGTRLGGNILFVASYQKKNPTPAAPQSGSQPMPAAKTNAPSTTVAPAPRASPPKAATNAAAAPANSTRKISTNAAKPKK
jgi:Tfp pilus assembly protein PilO